MIQNSTVGCVMSDTITSENKYVIFIFYQSAEDSQRIKHGMVDGDFFFISIGFYHGCYVLINEKTSKVIDCLKTKGLAPCLGLTINNR